MTQELKLMESMTHKIRNMEEKSRSMDDRKLYFLMTIVITLLLCYHEFTR